MSAYELDELIGHRGVPQLRPENSAEGLQLASELGYRWCEIDVQATSDGVAMLHHDFNVKKTDQLVTSMTAAEFAGVNIGTEAYVVHPPTLSQALATASAGEIGLVVEIKVKESVEAVVQATAETIVAGPALPLLVSSFNPEALAAFHELLPELPLAIFTRELPKLPLPDFYANVHFNYQHFDQQHFDQLKQTGIGLYAYTVNDATELEELLTAGVDGVFTDEEQLLKLLPDLTTTL